jgi:hypothetical protein
MSASKRFDLPLPFFPTKTSRKLLPSKSSEKLRRFPYALSDNSPEARLPSYVPRLSDYPANIADLFKPF